MLRSSGLDSLHNEMGYLGVEQTLELVRARFYWPKMSSDVEAKIRTCRRCVRRKGQQEKAASLVNIQTSRPMELVCMDFLSLDADIHNTKDILVITDHFAKYAAISIRDQKPSTLGNVLVHYGFPEHLIVFRDRI